MPVSMHAASPIEHPPFTYHGGKFRIADWVISFFPEHRKYVEPFGGAAGVLLRKKPSEEEIYNDLDGDVLNFFRVMRDKEQRDELTDRLRFTPFSRGEWKDAYQSADEPVERARRLAIRAMMSFGSAGATKSVNGFRTKVDGRWKNYPRSLDRIGARFATVLLENLPAIEIIRREDGFGTLFYVDPPYVLGTRKITNGGYYRFEMSDEDHRELLSVLCEVKGMVIVSGYGNPIYDEMLAGWRRFDKVTSCAAHRGSTHRVDSVWLNPACAKQQKQASLFGSAS